jgi:hypothetical protein
MRHATPDMLPRFFAFLAACPPLLTCVELGGAVNVLLSTYKPPQSPSALPRLLSLGQLRRRR